MSKNDDIFTEDGKAALASHGRIVLACFDESGDCVDFSDKGVAAAVEHCFKECGATDAEAAKLASRVPADATEIHINPECQVFRITQESELSEVSAGWFRDAEMIPDGAVDLVDRNDGGRFGADAVEYQFVKDWERYDEKTGEDHRWIDEALRDTDPKRERKHDRGMDR